MKIRGVLSSKGEPTRASTSGSSRRHKKARAIAAGELEDREELITVFPGQSKQAMIVTDRRLLIVKPRVMGGASGAKLGSFALEDISTINLHTGFGVAALEVVVAGQDKPDKLNLRKANQLLNWLPCHPKVKKSPFVRELRAYVQSDGRARSARDALSGSETFR